MKKLLTLLLALSTMLVAGCGDRMEAVSVIGGADGPTEVFVTDDYTDEEKEGLKMVNIEGRLYYDTGDERDCIEPVENFDGELVAGTNSFAVPKEKNSSNFYEGTRYKAGNTPDTVEIPEDKDEMMIFRLIDEEFIRKYSYCYEIEGELTGVGECEFAVFANDTDVSLSDAMAKYKNSPDSPDIYVIRLYD